MSSELELEVERLKHALKQEQKERARLEDECDILAFDNERLREENVRLKALAKSSTVSGDEARKVVPVDVASSSSSSAPVDVFIEGDGLFAKSLARKVIDANGSKNVICTAFMSFVDDDSGEAYDVLLSGGVDCTLSGYEASTGFRLFTYKLSGPVLAIDVHEDTVACSLMDGGHAIIRLSHSDCEMQPVTQVKDHSKYVVSVRFSSDGRFLATASHDKSVNLYKRNDDTEDYDKVRTLQFVQTPESLAFTALPAAGEHELIIGLREVSHLVYLHCDSFEQRQISLNEKDWDTHVSYTPLYLSVCPENKFLLISTDKNLIYVVKIGTNQRVRTLAGHSSGDYSKPVAVWDCTGRYVYTNSEEDSAVYIYSLATERVVGKLHGGHKGIVRGVACHGSKRLALTASYDKSIIMWDHQA